MVAPYPDCGVVGDTPDARYGKWVSANFSDTKIRTLYNARRLFEVFHFRMGRENPPGFPPNGL